MSFLLDTDTCVYWLRGHETVRLHLTDAGPEDIAFSAVILAELRNGAECSSNSTSRAVNANPGISDCAPHLEKMLYDNAQLARVYLHAWQLTGNDFYRTIALEMLAYAARDA